MGWRHTAMLILLPVIVIGGYVLAPSLPLGFDDVYEDFAGPFLITTWIGLGFSNVWFALSESLLRDKAGPGKTAASALIVALVMFLGVGGFPTLWEEPWLIGAAVWPGIDMAWPYFRERLETSRPQA